MRVLFEYDAFARRTSKRTVDRHGVPLGETSFVWDGQTLVHELNSERGCLFAQRVMTVFQTLRQQRRSVFAFLVDTCHAAQHGRRYPSLLPATR